MADKLMYIPYDETKNYPFCRLQLLVQTLDYLSLLINQSKFIKVLKAVKPTNKTLGTNEINSPLFPFICVKIIAPTHMAKILSKTLSIVLNTLFFY